MEEEETRRFAETIREEVRALYQEVSAIVLTATN